MRVFSPICRRLFSHRSVIFLGDRARAPTPDLADGDHRAGPVAVTESQRQPGQLPCDIGADPATRWLTDVLPASVATRRLSGSEAGRLQERHLELTHRASLVLLVIV